MPRLTLDVVQQADGVTEPLTITAVQQRFTRIVACNRAALAAGVRPGMSVNAALVLVPRLHCRPRDEAAMEQALERLALLAGGYTPRVSLRPPDGVLLEVSGSLHLHGGVGPLCRQLSERVVALGHEVVVATAPTPEAACLLARSGGGRVARVDHLRRALAKCSVMLLELDGRARQLARETGLLSLGQLFDIPRAELRQRFGPAAAGQIDRALGAAPDPRPLFNAPQNYRARLDLPEPVTDSEALLFTARRMLRELSVFLEMRGQGVRHLEFCFYPVSRSQVSHKLAMELLRPSRCAEHWLRLLKVRLEDLNLPDPVETLALRSDRPVPLKGVSGDLFEAGNSAGVDWAALVERLRSRLGRQAVCGLSLAADHRPERAWHAVPPDAPWARAEGAAGASGAGDSAPTGQGTAPLWEPQPANDAVGPDAAGQRPLWLLRQPQALLVGLPGDWKLRGPERIESGWWDGVDVVRDYYLATTDMGERLWVFQNRRDRQWFLHGFFA